MTINIPKDFKVESLAINKKRQVVLSGHTGAVPGLYLVEGDNGSLSKIGGQGTSGNACWVNDQLYYVGKDNTIVNYSVGKNASYVLYSNLGSYLSNLSCLYGNLYFFSKKTNDYSGAGIGRSFRLILDKDIGTSPLNSRPESLLPVLGDQQNNVSSADFFKNKISIVYNDFSHPNYNHPCSVNLSEKNKILDYLKSSGIDTKGYTVSMSYMCGSATG